MMNKKKEYEKKLISFDPETSMQETENHYSDDKFWDKVKKYAKQAGKQTVYYSLLLFYTAKSPSVPKVFEDDCSGGAQLSHFSG